MNANFKIGLTRDFLNPDGQLGYGDIGLELLDQHPGVSWDFLAENTPELRSDQICDYDALLVLSPRVSTSTLNGSDRLKVIARFGVGFDSVDVDACTRNGVLLTITPDGVRRPVAVSAITLLLALSHKLLIKDRLTREGRWHERLQHMGQGVTGRTLGIIGLGNIGREIVRLAAPFEMRMLGYDPHVPTDALAGLNVEAVALEELLTRSDYVIVCCALVPETRHLIRGSSLGMMKPGACLINVARGGVVNQADLTIALQTGRLGAAALDVFETEPVAPEDPILKLDNVIVTPHAVCWTDEMFLGTGRNACQSILDVADGRCPKHIVNREVLTQPQLRVPLSAI